MDTLFTALESGAVLVAGLAIRMGLLLVVLAALSVPVFLFLTGMKGVDAVRRRMQGVMRIGHLFWSDNVYYAPSHTWIRPVGRQRVRVGFDDLAQRLFQAPMGLKLAPAGTVVRAGDAVGEIRTARRRAPIVSPISGTITRANDAIREDASLLHRDPYARGWLFTVAPSDNAYETLPTGARAKNWLWDEEHRLSRGGHRRRRVHQPPARTARRRAVAGAHARVPGDEVEDDGIGPGPRDPSPAAWPFLCTPTPAVRTRP
jgi:glycine cleavage system H protein